MHARSSPHLYARRDRRRLSQLAEWVRAQALDPSARLALVGENSRDVREVMIEGVSGLLSVHEHRERPDWSPSRDLLVWRNGAIAQAFSAEDPDSLRGPQFTAPGATSLPSGAMPKRHSTCCSSGCALARGRGR